MAKNPRQPNGPPRAKVPRAGSLELQGKDVRVEWPSQAPRPAAPREIHARRPAPPIPRGKPVKDAKPSPPVNLQDRRAPRGRS